MKFNCGYITNGEGTRKDVIVESKLPFPITVETIAGIGGIAVGTFLLLWNSFQHGCNKYMNTEFNTLKDLGLVNPGAVMGEEVNKSAYNIGHD